MTPVSDYVCDFCGGKPVPWEYPVSGPVLLFASPVDGRQMSDDSEWCACQQCADAIDSGDFGGLAERMLAANPQVRGHEDNPRVLEMLRQSTHDRLSGFWFKRLPRRPAT